MENQPACYAPIEGGYRIRILGDGPIASSQSVPQLGDVLDNPRLHRRPLYPPADKSLLWSPDQLEKIQRCGFRPLVVAYHEPRFLFDFHSAGGLLGHLFVGLGGQGESKWFHEWSEIQVSYLDGRMEYRLTDPEFPSVAVTLAALPLAHSAGLILRVRVEGDELEALNLVWAYGGASAFFTNYNLTAPEFAFSPDHCAKDRITLDGHRFRLRRSFDDSDVYTKEVFAVTRYLEGWEAEIVGGGSWNPPVGFSAPDKFLEDPAALIEAATWNSTGTERLNGVAVQKILLGQENLEGYIAIGMGGDIESVLENPVEAWQAGLDRNRQIADRVLVQTPDPYLNAAARMMAFATEGTWGDSAILHGGWSWRFAYLGWRGWYGSNCYGWSDRVKKSIENHTTLGLVREGPDEGALGSLLEYNPGVFYNMNEVFFDQVRQYFEYTNDLDLMQKIFPVLEGILKWENRRLQPEGASLYENSLNTWISDSHWYTGGQCAQASAYMLRAHTFTADLAERLGKDPAPYRDKANLIGAALQANLWVPEKGVFAEYLDTRGARLLHPEPELPTIYHTAEFGAADPRQIDQMLDWADRHLRQETTPGGGKLFWSSNWFPNRGRSYTHSTYEIAYAEELNFALVQYLGGRAEEAYALIRATLCGIFNGPTPGGLSCHSLIDGRQRANDEFSDAISMWGRAVVEGLFGIVPKKPDGVVELTPQFPQDWPEASIKTPFFSYRLKREPGKVRIDWECPHETSVHLRLHLSADRIDRVTVDNQVTESHIERGFGSEYWVQVKTPSATRGTLSVEYIPAVPSESKEVAAPQERLIPEKVWTAPDAGARDLDRWVVVDLANVFNASVTEVLQRVTESAQPPVPPASEVGFGYWKDHLLQYHGSRNQPISDAAWRAKVGPDGVAWTTDGIPFKTSKTGRNISVVTLAGGFPNKLEFPVNAQGRVLYLMLSGMTFPAQSHVTNLRVTLSYADGQRESVDLVNPFTIGDCWSTWCGRFHDTAANGFENIGGRSGPSGSSEVQDLTQPVALDTEAHLVPFPLRQESPLTQLDIEAVANDVIFGVMGVSLLK